MKSRIEVAKVLEDKIEELEKRIEALETSKVRKPTPQRSKISE